MQSLFFGYAESDTNARESLQSAASRLAANANVDACLTWEDLRVDGKIIVNDILETINKSTLCVFDLTSLNDNVLFELGAAIGFGRPVTITREGDNAVTDRLFREFSLLTTTGYTSFLNSDDLVAKLTAITASPPPPLLDVMLGDAETPFLSDRMTYIPSMKEDESSRKLSRLLESHSALTVETLELDEYGTAPLAWLTQQLYASAFAIFHFTPADAYLAETSNRRAALLAGIAVGLGRASRIAMRAADPVALDFRDLRIAYTTSKSLVQRTESWLSGLGTATSKPTRIRKHLSVELAALRFGNHVAEADAEGLERYFVETRDFLDVVEANATIFSGRKGTGKTANMLQAASVLRSDARNLVCVVKPASYELEALAEILGRVTASHIGNYLVEGVWKYLLYTETASELVRQAERTPAGIPNDSALSRLRDLLEADHKGIDASFSVRLEGLVDNLDLELRTGMDESRIGEARERIGRSLYGGHIKKLRTLLIAALHDKSRVAVLIDNLDKAWERGADLKTLSEVILGLLTAVGRMSDEFAREESRASHGFRFTLTAFLRSDIYAHVRSHAREPDKIASVEIEWRDRDLLARVLEDRFVAARGGESQPGDLWNQYFVEKMHGLTSKEYILSRVQPRPRDLVFFANAAVSHATNSRHGLINEDDVEKAELSYSQFAYDALLVEGLAGGVDMESLLMSFVGESSHFTHGELREILEEGGIFSENQEEYIAVLRQQGFLGIEVSPDVYDYGGTVGEIKKAEILSRKLQKSAGRPRRYEVHPAYRRHLLMDEID